MSTLNTKIEACSGFFASSNHFCSPWVLEMVEPVYPYRDDCLLVISTNDDGTIAKNNFKGKLSSFTKD
jgi:hypothetical protein